MRIIAGSHRGAKLTRLATDKTRPTADRIREALFNILDGGKFGRVLENAHVIDAFAGTGALGLEALSRGALTACFIEQDRNALSSLQANINKLEMQSRSTIIPENITKLSNWPHPPAAVMFVDAPYKSGAGQAAVSAIRSIGGLAPQAILILEMHKSEILDHNLLSLTTMKDNETRIYGKTALHFITYSG